MKKSNQTILTIFNILAVIFMFVCLYARLIIPALILAAIGLILGVIVWSKKDTIIDDSVKQRKRRK